jgi:hypothetical protein
MAAVANVNYKHWSGIASGSVEGSETADVAFQALDPSRENRCVQPIRARATGIPELIEILFLRAQMSAPIEIVKLATDILY